MSEEDLREIENGEGWYENYRDKLPEDLYDEISTAIDEIYEKASKEFDAFHREFKNDIWDIKYEARVGEISKHNEVIIAEYGCPDWANEKSYSYSDFIYMCAGDYCAIPCLLDESISDELDEEECVVDYTIMNKDEKRIYFVKSTRDRILCLNDLM